MRRPTGRPLVLLGVVRIARPYTVVKVFARSAHVFVEPRAERHRGRVLLAAAVDALPGAIHF